MPTSTLIKIEGGKRQPICSARDDDKSQKAKFVAAQVRAINDAHARGAPDPDFDIKTHDDEYDLPFEKRHEKTQPLPHEAEAHAEWLKKQNKKLEELNQ